MNNLSTVALSALVAGIAPVVSAAPLTVVSTGIPGGATVEEVNPTRAAIGIGVVGGCSVRLSFDSGKTWVPVALPPPQPTFGTPRSYCSQSAPAVLYSADGTLLFAAYAYSYYDEVNGYNVSGSLFSVSADHGITWSYPAAITPEVDIYVSETTPGYFGQKLMVSSSPGGQSWTTTAIAESDGESGTVQGAGSSITAGTSGVVLVAYGTVGFSTGPQRISIGAVKVARSFDNGATFLGPKIDHYTLAIGSTIDRNPRGWLSNPDIKIGPQGMAHIVYDRTRNGVFYKYSMPPYTRWTTFPIGAGPIGSRVSEPRITAGWCGPAGVLSATWLEAIETQPTRIAYTYKIAKNGYRWTPPLKADAPANMNYLAGSNGNALIVVGGGLTPVTEGGTASSGLPCR